MLEQYISSGCSGVFIVFLANTPSGLVPNFENVIPHAEARLEPSQASTMELFCKNN